MTSELSPTGTPPLRISVVSPVFGGSFPVAAEAADALSALGHEVTFFDLRSFAQPYAAAAQAGTRSAQSAFYDAVRAHLVARLADKGCDALIALSLAPLRAPFVDELRRSGVVTAMWYVEPFERFAYYRAIAPHYDWFLRIQDSPFSEELDRLGARQHSYLPLAARSSLLHDTPAPSVPECYRSPIAFFGSPYENRLPLLAAAADLGLSLWGEGFSKVSPPLSDCVRSGDRFLDAKVEHLVYLGSGMVLNPHSQTAQETQADFVNPRTFQLAAMARFQLVDERSLLRRHFTDDEVIAFSNAADLREKVLAYQRDIPSRDRIAQAARARVASEHTYEHRMRTLVNWLTASGSDG